MTADTIPNDWRELREPWTGPRTGDQLAALGALGEMAAHQASADTARLPVYEGPQTGDQMAAFDAPGQHAIDRAAAGMAHTLSLERRGNEQLPRPTRPGLRRIRSHGGGLRGSGAVRVEAREVPRGALSDAYDIPSVEFRRRHAWLWAGLAGLASLAGLARHAWYAATVPAERPVQILWAAGFLWMGMQWALSWLDRPSRVTPAQQAALEALRVTVNIPLYNEDPAIVDRVLYALAAQSRPVNRVEVVDDGSTVDYSEVRDHWQRHLPLAWIRQPNAGKKHAQVNTFRSPVHADIIVTIDSDTALEGRAIAEGLKPFADPRVQSVAGFEVAANPRANWLTRTASARSLFFQITACGVQSAFGEILVNRGAFALYRGDLLRDIADSYVGETFRGVPIRLGDDAALTLFARGRGRTVQQPSAFSFTMYPERLSHHFKQWIRWMRATLIRDCWRLRYLPVTSYGWWFTVVNTTAFLMMSGTLVLVAARWPESAHYAESGYLAMSGWAFLTSLRLLAVRRSDETWLNRIATLFFYPMALLWGNLVLRPLRFYGIVTWKRQGWVTRDKVEVGLSGDGA